MHDLPPLSCGEVDRVHRVAFRSSIRFQLTAFVSTLVLLAAGALSWTGYLVARNILKEQIGARLTAIASDRQSQLLAYVEQQQEKVSLISSRTRLRELLEARVTRATPEDQFRAESRRILMDIQKAARGFQTICITDRTGQVVTATDDASLLLNFADNQDFVAGLQSTHFGNPWRAGDGYKALLTGPVANKDGNVLGVVVAIMDQSRMLAFLSNSTSLGQSGTVMVGAPHGTGVNYLLPPRGHNVTHVSSKTAPAMAAALRGEHGFVRTRDFRGVDVLAAYRPVNYQSWGLVTKMDSAEAYAPIHRLRNWLLLMNVAILVPGLAGCYWLAIRFTRPIIALARTAAEITDGNLNARVAVYSSNEIGELSATFNRMTAELVASQSMLQRRVEERTAELAKSEATFRELFESSRDAILVFDENNIVDCNQAALRLFGAASVGELQSYHYADLSPSSQLCGHNSRELADGHISKAHRDGSNCFEWLHQRVGGAPFIAEVMLSTIEHEGKQAILANVRDISERKAIENALRESEQRFLQLASNSDDIFWITSADGREIVYLSPAFEKIWERTCESLYAHPSDWLEAIHPEDRDRVAQSFFDTLTTGTFDEEYRLIRRDGSVRWILARGSIVKDAAGNAVRLAGVARDVTDRWHYEEELRQAKLLAEEASQAKGQFLASMSHELRTPLNGVIGMIELLVGTRLDDHQRRFAEACQTSARSLLELINDVLDFSKIEAGKIVLDEHEFELGQVVEDAARLVGGRAHQKGLELVCSIHVAARQWFRGDSMRLRQVLVNLLNNALKFTPTGEVVVRVELEASLEQAGAILRFEISDTGIGIPSDRVPHLFNRFVQVDSSTSRTYGGTGLGLAICKSLVEAMGGDIGVESQEGIGSKFWFTTLLQQVPDRASQSIIPQELRRLRVLVVSERRSLADTLHELISAWGMNPSQCATGYQALAKLRQCNERTEKIDLVIVDQHLADMSGSELYSAVSSKPALQSTSVFLLTTIADAVEGLRSIDRRISKPVCHSELLNTIVDCFCPPTIGFSTIDAVKAADETTSTSKHAGKVRVLLAEDNRINQMFARELLRRAGLDCDCVVTGAQAVEAAQTGRHDLILMDCHMPEMDGFEASNRIRQLERDGKLAGHLPIVALTANALLGDRERCLRAGMDGYLSKPFEAKSLVELIDRLLDGSSSRQVEHQHPTPATLAEGKLRPIDGTALVARCMGDAGFARSLLDELESTGEDRVEQIARHVAAHDSLAVAEAAHSLKGAAGIIAAESVQSLAAAIEIEGESGDLDNVASLVEDLRREMRRCLDFIPTLRQQSLS